MPEMIEVSEPHALYYDGHLLGIITNPVQYGTVGDLCNAISPNEGLADAVPLKCSNEEMAGAVTIKALGRQYENTAFGYWSAIERLLHEVGVSRTSTASKEDLLDELRGVHDGEDDDLAHVIEKAISYIESH